MQIAKQNDGSAVTHMAISTVLLAMLLALSPAFAQNINTSSRSMGSRSMDTMSTPTWRTPTRDTIRDPNTGKPLAIIEGPSGIVGNEYTVRNPNTGRPKAKISP